MPRSLGCGIISQDHDLEELYFDSFLKIAGLEECEDLAPGACHTRAFTDATNAGLAASMARAGIDCSVVLPVATNPHQVAHVNESAAQINARGRGTGIYSFGCIHPDYEDWTPGESWLGSPPWV